MIHTPIKVSVTLLNLIYSTDVVGEICMVSNGEEHAAIGASKLENCSGMDLQKVLVNAKFQNFPHNLKIDINNASGVEKNYIRGRGNEHSAIGDLASADHSDMNLDKATLNSEFHN